MGFEMVTIIAEATGPGGTVWYYGESIPAADYDGRPSVRVSVQATVTERLAEQAPAGLPVVLREERWSTSDALWF